MVTYICPPLSRTVCGEKVDIIRLAADIISSNVLIEVVKPLLERSISASDLFGVIIIARGNKSLIRVSSASGCSSGCPEVEIHTGSQMIGGLGEEDEE